MVQINCQQSKHTAGAQKENRPVGVKNVYKVWKTSSTKLKKRVSKNSANN
jgi:hypothetical protein